MPHTAISPIVKVAKSISPIQPVLHHYGCGVLHFSRVMFGLRNR